MWIGKTLSKLINSENKEKVIGPQRKPIIFRMPYLGSYGHEIKKKIIKLVREFYPQVSLRVIYTARNTIGSFFKYKDKLPDDLRSSIVYLYKCDSCNASYIGKSERHYRTRKAEHEGRSVRTGNLLSKPPHSAIRDHCHSDDHRMKQENFSILDSSPGRLDLVIMEALYQHKHKPSLGKPSYELSCL